jgi:hypothetical protein
MASPTPAVDPRRAAARPGRRWLLGLLLCAGSALANTGAPARLPELTPPSEVAAELPGAIRRGSAVMRVLGLHIADIRLWSPAPAGTDASTTPLALELVYARALSGRRIASSSISEMRRLGPFSDEQAARWEQAMRRIFPDVLAGDRLTGVQWPGEGARFFLNGRPRGELADAEFTRLFFGIWLSPRSSEPDLRRQLLGGPT